MEAVEIVLAVLHIIGAVHWTPAHKKAECVVFRSAEEMAAVWLADGGKQEALPKRYDDVGEIRVFDEGRTAAVMMDRPPAINFGNEMVLAVFAGQKPTGGHGVKIEKVVYAAAKKTVWVIYGETSPAPPQKPDFQALRRKLAAAQAAVDEENLAAARRLADEARALMQSAEQSAVIQVLTYPSHVVAVKKVEGEVKFVKAGSEEAAQVEDALKAAKTK